MTGNELESAVETAFCDYLQRLDAGETVDRKAFLAGYPEIAEALDQHLSADSVVRQMAGPAEAVDTARLDATLDFAAPPGAVTETASLARSVDTHPEGDREQWGIPPRFGRYQVRKLLGQGAMGAVYLAHDTQLQRDVALKIPKFDKGTEAELLERFYREARAAATLRHPHICPVYDVGEIDGQTFLSMAFIPGQPLSHFSKASKRQSERSVARLVMKLALGLQEAHKLGVVHRDLKPANIMVAENGEPVVMDFGLARRMDSTDTRVTRSDAILGTPAYMSPEQVEGNPDAVGPASDQYSLGVILYELLTGQLPFQGTVMSVIGQIAHKKPTDIQELRPDIDPRLANICRKMMAKKPDARFKEMATAAAALNRYLQESKAGATPSNQSILQPPPQPKPTAKLPPTISHRLPGGKKKKKSAPSRKTWLLAGLGSLALFVLLSGVIYFTTGDGAVRFEIKDPEIQVTFQGETFTIDDNGVPMEVRPGKYTLKVKRGDLDFETRQFTISRNGKAAIEITWLGGELLAKNGPDILGRKTENPAALPKRPETVSPKTSPAENPTEFTLLDKLEGARDNIDDMAFSVDGRSLFVACAEKEVQQWDLAQKKIVRRIPVGDYAISLAVHPDGEHLFTGESNGGIQLWNLQTGRRVREFPGNKQSASVVVSPDGKRLLSAGRDGLARLWNVETAEVEREFADGYCGAAALSPDGKLAAHAVGGNFRLWETATGNTLHLVARHNHALGVISFSPDGESLATSDYMGLIQVWEVNSGRQIYRFDSHTQRVFSLLFARDGRHLISGSMDQSLRVFNMTSGLEALTLKQETLCVSHLALAPDGQTLASGGGLQVLKAVDGKYTSRKDGDYAVRLWRLPQSLWTRKESQ